MRKAILFAVLLALAACLPSSSQDQPDNRVAALEASIKALTGKLDKAINDAQSAAAKSDRQAKRINTLEEQIGASGSAADLKDALRQLDKLEDKIAH